MSSQKSLSEDSCPICENPQIDLSLKVSPGVCENCGFVISEDPDDVPPEWPSKSRASTDSKDWLEVSRVHNATEKQLALAFADIESVSDELRLPVSMRKKAAEIYCDAYRTKTTDGRDTTSLVGACVRLASVELGKPIPNSKIHQLDIIDENKCQKSYFALKEALEVPITTLSPTGYFWFFEHKLNVSNPEKEKIEEILDNISGEQELVGKDPVGTTAATIYIICTEYTQSEVASTGGVSTETLRARSNQLQELISCA